MFPGRLGWVLRSVGGTLGGQLSGSLPAGRLLPGTSLPSSPAFVTAFWADLAVGLLALVGSLALRRRATLAGPTLLSPSGT